MARVKRYWSTGDLAKALGVTQTTVVAWIRTQRTFPPPDIEFGPRGHYGWDPGREDEIRKWMTDRQSFRGLKGGQSVNRYMHPRLLPPVERKQKLTNQQEKLQEKGFVAVPAREVLHGDIRPWGGVVNRVTLTPARGLYVIHDDVLGASKAIGGKSMVMIQRRPDMDGYG